MIGSEKHKRFVTFYVVFVYSFNCILALYNVHRLCKFISFSHTNLCEYYNGLGYLVS